MKTDRCLYMSGYSSQGDHWYQNVKNPLM